MTARRSAKSRFRGSWKILGGGAFGVMALTVALWPGRPPFAAVTGAARTVEFVAADLDVVRQEASGNVIHLTGTLNPLKQTVVNAHAGGEVLEVLAREGESVRRGQLLVRQDMHDLQAHLHQAEATLAASHVDETLAEEYVGRVTRLHDQKMLSDVDFANYRAQASSRAEVVKANTEAVSIARKALTDAEVRAPQNGMVAERMVEPGQMVNPNAPLLKIVDLSQMELAAQASPEALPLLHIGQEIRFKVGGFVDEVFSGHIVRFNPMAQAGTRDITVYASVPNPGMRLRGGMFAQAEIQVADSAHRLWVPVTALQDRHGVSGVYVIRQQRLVWQVVTLGDRREERMGVNSGLNAGERIVIIPLSADREGAQVKLPQGV